MLGERRHPYTIPVMEDECIYHSCDDYQGYWQLEGDTPHTPKHKSEGQGIMVGLFLTETGVLRLDAEELRHAKMKMQQSCASMDDIAKFSGDSTFTLEYGRARDGYMDGKQFQAHVVNAINVFRAKYPRDKCVLVLDHSSVHLRLAADALNVNKINLHTDSDKMLRERKKKARETKALLTPMRNGWYHKNGKRVEQKMYTADGRRRGLLDLLAERGFKGKYSLANAREKLGAQPDFAVEKSELEEMCEKMGVRVVKSPKYHPEFNPVELAWAAGKLYAREKCNYTIASLRKVIPHTIDLLSPELIQKMFSHCRAWRKAYTPKEAGGDGAQNGSEARSIIQATRRQRRQSRKLVPWVAATASDLLAWKPDDETEEVEPIHEEYQMASSHRAISLPPQLYPAVRARIAEMPRIDFDTEDAPGSPPPRAKRTTGEADGELPPSRGGKRNKTSRSRITDR